MCTAISVRSKEGLIAGRTMEFGFDLNFTTIFLPRQYEIVKNSGTEGDKLTTQYAFMGSNFLDLNGVNDGINEHGLMGSINYFPGYASYQEKASGTKKYSLGPENLLSFILGNCKDIDEVKELIKDVELIESVQEALGFTLPLHYALFDKAGNAIVIEPQDKTLYIHDNPVGVMTNSPDFQWHLTNLRNYVNNSPVNSDSVTLRDTTFTKFGQGTGLAGIPGDFTPPARFVRAAFFAGNMPEQETSAMAVNQAFHILNNFDLPLGSTVDHNAPKESQCEITFYTAVMDSNTLEYYIKSHLELNIHRYRLTDFDFDSKEKIIHPLDKHTTFIEA